MGKITTFNNLISVAEDLSYKMDRREELVAFLKQFPGRVVSCEYKLIRNANETTLLRRYYWNCPISLIQHRLHELFGHFMEREEVHEFVKEYCPSMKEYDIEIMGKSKPKYKSIAAESFTNQDFLLYIEELRAWAKSALDIEIKEPDPMYKIVEYNDV